jgi:hypothetical protein
MNEVGSSLDDEVNLILHVSGKLIWWRQTVELDVERHAMEDRHTAR